MLPFVVFQLLLPLLKTVDNRPVNSSVMGFFPAPPRAGFCKEILFLNYHLSTSLGIVSNGIRNRAAKMMHVCIYFPFWGAGDRLNKQRC